MGNQSPCIRLASCAKRARGRTLLASWPGDSRAGRRQPHPLSCCRRRCPHGSSPSCPCDRRRSTLRFRVGHESMRGGGPSVRCRVRSWEETKPANWSSRQELSAIKQAKPARGAPWMFWLPPCAARRLCMLPIQSFGCARRRAARRARSCKAACGERRGGGGGTAAVCFARVGRGTMPQAVQPCTSRLQIPHLPPAFSPALSPRCAGRTEQERRPQPDGAARWRGAAHQSATCACQAEEHAGGASRGGGWEVGRHTKRVS